jgi:hypothetical protein
MCNSSSSSFAIPTSSRRAISLLASPRAASWCWCVVAGSRWDQDTRTPGYAGRQAARRHRRTRSSSLLSRSRAPKGGALLVTRRCTSPSRHRRCHLKLCACRAWCARRRCLYRPSVFSAGARSRGAGARSRGRGENSERGPRGAAPCWRVASSFRRSTPPKKPTAAAAPRASELLLLLSPRRLRASEAASPSEVSVASEAPPLPPKATVASSSPKKRRRGTRWRPQRLRRR